MSGKNPKTTLVDTKQEVPSPESISEAIRCSLGIPVTVWKQRMRQAERLKGKEGIGQLHKELLSKYQLVPVEGKKDRLQAKPGAGTSYNALIKAIGEVITKQA